MSPMSKRAASALAALALFPLAASAVTVKSPIPGTVMVTTYQTSGAFHGAVDVSSGRCNVWDILAPAVGSLSWSLNLRNSVTTCANTTANDNVLKHVFANGFTLRLTNFLATSDSRERTCDRCSFGRENVGGAAIPTYVHVEVTKNGTLDTSWYGGYTTRGEAVGGSETLGIF